MHTYCVTWQTTHGHTTANTTVTAATCTSEENMFQPHGVVAFRDDNNTCVFAVSKHLVTNVTNLGPTPEEDHEDNTHE